MEDYRRRSITASFPARRSKEPNAGAVYLDGFAVDNAGAAGQVAGEGERTDHAGPRHVGLARIDEPVHWVPFRKVACPCRLYGQSIFKDFMPQNSTE